MNKQVLDKRFRKELMARLIKYDIDITKDTVNQVVDFKINEFIERRERAKKKAQRERLKLVRD